MSQTYTYMYMLGGQRISCELTNGDENSKWTTVTLSSENNQPDFMERIHAIAQNWAEWAETHRCQTDVFVKNNQIAISLDGRAEQIQNWLGNLEERFTNAGSRMTMTAGVGAINAGTTASSARQAMVGTSGLGGGSSGLRTAVMRPRD